MSAIESYVSELDRRLSGSARAKTDLLTEARDGLYDAAEAYREGGTGELEAEVRAVADFGPAPEVAGAYQQELALRGNVGTLWKLIIGVPVLQLVWEATRISTYGDWSKLGPTPRWYLFLIDLTGILVVAVPVIGAVTLLGTRLLARRFDGARLAKAARWPTGLAVGANLVAMLMLSVGTVVLDPPRMYLSVPCAALAIGWSVFSFWLITQTIRSWRPRPLIAA